MNYVGDRLKEIRNKNHLSQEKMAEILNTNRIRICKIESGKMQMYFDEALILCQYFNISADTFFEEKNLSKEDYSNISNRFIKNSNISINERRDTLRKIHIDFESEAFKLDIEPNVLNNNNTDNYNTKSSNFDIERYLKK